ncbi:MAG: hypothetical protein ACKVX9_07810 [Blastocatellia bacterium]
MKIRVHSWLIFDFFRAIADSPDHRYLCRCNPTIRTQTNENRLEFRLQAVNRQDQAGRLRAELQTFFEESFISRGDALKQ